MTELERIQKIKDMVKGCEIYPDQEILPVPLDDLIFLLKREERLRKSLKQARLKLAGMQSNTRHQWDCDSDYLPYEEDDRDR